VSILGPVTVEIRDVNTDVQFKAHLNHVKPFRSSAEFSYALEDEESDGEIDEPGLIDDPLGPMAVADADPDPLGPMAVADAGFLGPAGLPDADESRVADASGELASLQSDEATVDDGADDGPISSRLRSRCRVPDGVDPGIAALYCGVRAPDFLR